MKDWVISLSVAVLSISIIALLLPNGKTSLFIKKIFAILLVFVVLQPINTFQKNDFNYENIFLGGEIDVQEEYLSFIANKKIEEYKKNCLTITKEKGIENAEIIIDYTFDESFNISLNYITINLRNSVIKSDKEHINIIDEVKGLISDYTRVEKDKIIVYEREKD